MEGAKKKEKKRKEEKKKTVKWEGSKVLVFHTAS
jgi:hypothetical protein